MATFESVVLKVFRVSEAKKLKDRWHMEQGASVYKDVIRALTGSKSFNSGVIPQHNGMWDLRGITLPPELEIDRARLADIDFSYATMYSSSWVKCALRNTLFFNAKMDYSKFWACEIDDVVFEKSYLNEVLMNGRIGNDNGYFRNVKFADSNLQGTVYSNSLFERCQFIDCNLRQVDFHGSRFAHCRFVGFLDEVMFHGVERVNRKLFPDVRSIPNKMEHVDFSAATLDSVRLFDDIDLSTCVFPDSDQYIYISENRILVFEHVRKVIDNEWSGMNKRIGLGLIDGIYLSPRHRNNSGEFIDKQFMVKTDNDFGEKFFRLIRETNERFNGSIR